MPDYSHLPWDAPLEAYDAQATALLVGHGSGDAATLALLNSHLPQFLDAEVTWKPRDLTDAEMCAAPLTRDDMRLAVARRHGLRDWAALETLVTAIGTTGSAVREFERAVEAVIHGELDLLEAMLDADATLVHARSSRLTAHDPPTHAATLLHYLAANGVEGHRQRSPANATEIARLLLRRGAQVDALAHLYGAECTTLSMLVSSTPPADAGVQVPLVHVLMDSGADPEGAGRGAWQSPLMTALVFGYFDSAEALVARGARVDDLPKAAGLGRVDEARALLSSASPDERHRALALAGIGQQVAVVQLLLEAGEDPNRFNPDGFHAHGTPLHQAALTDNLPLVQLLVAHGARTDIRDGLWNATPLGWAEYADRHEVAAYLRSVAG
jgi:hypothetical protein